MIVAFPFVGGFVGGSHLSAAKLIENLDRERYQPLVLLHRPEGQVADLFRDGGIAFEPAPSERFLEGASLRDDLGFLLAEMLPPRAISAPPRRVRIVHTNDGRTHATWALPTRLAGARLLWHHRKDPDAKGCATWRLGRRSRDLGVAVLGTAARPARQRTSARSCTACSIPTPPRSIARAPAAR